MLPAAASRRPEAIRKLSGTNRAISPPPKTFLATGRSDKFFLPASPILLTDCFEEQQAVHQDAVIGHSLRLQIPFGN
jgi:hypothetical protein